MNEEEEGKEENMDANKIGEHTAEIVRGVEKMDLKIDEKIAVLRSAADLLQEVMVMETTTLSLRESMRLQFDKLR